MSAAGAPAGGMAAGNGSADAGGEAAQQNGHANGNGQPDGGPDYGKLSQQLEQLVGGQEELRRWLVNGGPEGEYNDDGDAFDGDDFEFEGFEGFDGEGFEGAAEPGGLDLDGDPEELTSQLMEQFDAATREAVAPLAHALAETRSEFAAFQDESQWKELLAEFPAIGQDPDYFVRATHAWAEVAGVPPSPHVARLVYLAHQGLAAAQAEMDREDAPATAHLEGGGGAMSAPRQSTPADRILNPGGKRGASVLDGI